MTGEDTDKPKSGVRLALQAVLFTAVIFAAAKSWEAISDSGAESRGAEFNRERWSDSDQTRTGVRQKMADRLIARGTLQGMTRTQVFGLLGEPPPTEYFKNWDLVYWLGPERGFISIDSEWLVVRLAADGRVDDCQILRD